METIRIYLDSMFSNLPDNERTACAKKKLLDMMMDRYNELTSDGKNENQAVAAVISELGNLSELSDELGIKDIIDGHDYDKKNLTKRRVTLEESKEYLAATDKGSFRIALGVFLCICSPIILIVLAGIFSSDENTNPVIQGIGLSTLLIFIAVAVGLFIYNVMAIGKYDYLKKEVLHLNIATENSLRQIKESKRHAYMIRITAGVILCIISIIPVIVAGSIVDGVHTSVQHKDAWMCIAAGAFLLIVAIAVFLFVKAALEQRAFKVLLQEGEFTEKTKEDTSTGNIAAVYWPVVTCIYLAWSFISGDWSRSWIIWPIAGVLFGAIASICAVAGKGTKQ